MKSKSIWYVLLMGLFGILAYLFINSGINTKTKVYVSYQEKSDVSYKVYLLLNDIYENEYLGMNQSYLSKMTDYIDFTFNYEDLFDRSINGFYSYNVTASLVAYTDSLNDSLWEKDYKILEDKVNVLNKNNINLIEISDNVRINYEKYRNELLKFSNDYDIEVSGYLLLKFNIKTVLDFKGLDRTVEDDKVIKVNIPLTSDTYKVNVINNYDDIDSYYDFSTRESLNYIFLIVGIFCLSVFFALLAVVIREGLKIRNRESRYTKGLRKILNEYDEAIVVVNKFYNKKKYNLIYLDSFEELIDVYKKVNMPINFKEMKKNYEAIFVIIHDDNAWIYRMIAKK